jgi:hypothetical protein
MRDEQFVPTPIGHVASSLVDPANAPKQGDEGAPDAWLDLEPHRFVPRTWTLRWNRRSRITAMAGAQAPWML